jgi:hypothetical protein
MKPKALIIIYGHKLHSHTHSYIHLNYFNAFRHLGHKVIWVDKKDEIENLKLDDAIFLTEGNVDGSIPLYKNAKYILHHCRVDKYKEKGCKYIQLRNYEHSPNTEMLAYEKINRWTYFDFQSMTLFQPWGTDLLPHQIRSESYPFDPTKNIVYYVGSIGLDVMDTAEAFASECTKQNITFKNICTSHVEYRFKQSLLFYQLKRSLKKIDKLFFRPRRPISDSMARRYVTESLVSPDFRNKHHIQVGYIPCRTFKNISYGVLPGTNSLLVNSFFDGLLPYSTNAAELLNVNIEAIKSIHFQEKMRHLKTVVAQNHTYINRAIQLLDVL